MIVGWDKLSFIGPWSFLDKMIKSRNHRWTEKIEEEDKVGGP